MRLRSLSLFVVLHTVSDRSRYCDIEAIINVDLLCAVTAALIRSMNNDFFDKLMHDLRSKLRDTLILLHHADECGHISGLLFGGFDIGSNQITISTRHSSKGLEFEVIIMMGMEENHFPGWWTKNNPNELLESNRICFVCVSRAKRVCILMHSNYYDEYDKRYDDTICKRYYPSRYLLELKSKFNTTPQL